MAREITSSIPLPATANNEELKMAFRYDGDVVGDECALLMVDTDNGNDFARDAICDLFAWNRPTYARGSDGELLEGPDGRMVLDYMTRVEHPLSAQFIAAYKGNDDAELGRIVRRQMEAGYTKAAQDAIDDLPQPDEFADDDYLFEQARDRAIERQERAA